MAGSSRGGSKYPNVATEYAYHGLHDACASGNVGLAKYALSAGQPVNSVLDGVLPIHAACAGGSDAVVRLLLSNGADVNAVRLPRKRPHRHKLDKLASPASLKGSSLAMAGTSVSGSSSADPTHHTSGRSGATPLHFAAANGHTHIVGLLLSWGAKAEAIDKHGVTPVELAAEGGHDDIVSTLEAWIAIHPSGSNQASPALVRQQVQAQLDAATPADLRGEVVSSRFGVHSHASRSNGSFGSTSGTGNGTTGIYDEFGSMGPGFASSAPREGSLRRTASAGGSLTLGARPLGTADVLRRIPSRGTTGSKESDHSTGTTSTGFLPPSPHRSRHNPHGPANPNYSPSDPLLPLPAASERRPSLPDISNPANVPPALLRGSRRPRSAGEDSDGGSGGFASMAAAVQAAPDGYVRVGRGLRKLGSKGGLLSLFRKPSGDLMALANSGIGASAAGNAAGKARQAPDSSDSELDDAEGDAGDVDSEGLSSLGPSTANTPSAWQTTFASSSTNGSQPDTSSNGSPVQSTLPREASESDMILASTHPYQAATVPGPRPRPRSVSSDLQLTGMSAPRPPMAALVTPSRAATTSTISTTPSRSTTLTSATTPSRSTTATSASSTTPSRSVTGTPGTASTARPIPPNNRGRKGSEVLAHSPLATEWRHAELSRQTSIDADDNEDVSDGEQGLRAVDDGLRAAMVDNKMLRPPLGRAELSAGSSFLQFDSRSNSSVGASPHAMEEQAEEEVASPEPMSAGFQQQQQQHPPTDRGAPPPPTAATTAPIPVSRRRGGRPSTAESRIESSSMPSVFSGSPPLVSTGHSPGRPGPMRSPSPVRLGLRSPSPFRSGRAPSPHLRGAALNTSPGVRSRALPSNTSPGIRSRALPPSPSMRPKGLGSPALRANLTLSGSPPGHDGLVVPPSGMRMRSDSAESEVVAVGGSGNGSGRSASGSVSSGGPGHQRRTTDGQPPTYDGHTRAQSHDALGIVGGHYQAALNPNLSHTRPRRSTASLSFSSEESGTGSEALDDGPAPLRPTGKRLHSNSAASGGSSSGAGSVRRGARSPSASGFHPGISGAGNNSPTPDIRSHAQATALVAQTRAAILDAAEDEDDLELEEQLARLGETIELEKRFARGEAQRRVWGLREEDTPIVVGSPIERPRLAAASRTQSGGQANVKGTPPVTPSRLPTGGAPSEPATVATESTITPGATFRSPRTATLELGSQSIHVASPTPIGATLTLPSASPGKTSFGDPFMQNSSGALGLGLQVDVPPHRQAIALEVQPPSALPTPSTSPHPNDAHNGTIHGFGAAGELAGSASTNGSSGGSGIGLGGRTRTTSSTVGALPTSSSTSAAPASGTTSLGSKLGRIMSNSNANSSGDMSRWMGGASLTRVVTAPTTPSGEPPPMHGRKSSLTGSTMGDTVAPTAPSAGGGGGGLRSRLGGLRKVFGGGKGKA